MALCLSIVFLAMLRWRSTIALVDNVAAVFEEPEWAGSLGTADRVLDYIAANPEDAALVVTTLGDGHDGLRHNDDARMPLASTMTIVHLAGWAQAVESGRIDPSAEIAVERWKAWHLPNTDGGSHDDALEDLGIDGMTGAATWDGVARAMVRFGDHAAADLIREELGGARLDAAAREGGLPSHDPITSMAGVLLTYRDHDRPGGDSDLVATLLGQPVAARIAMSERRAEQWLGDPVWAEEERRWRREGAALAKLRDQAALAELFPQATARGYAAMLSAVAEGSFLSPEASRNMREHLGWPLAVGRNAERFSAFGTQSGALPGVLTEATYVTPRQGAYAGRTRVVVLFLRGLPMSAWLTMMESSAQKFFVLRIAQHESFQSKVAQRLRALSTGD